MANINTDVVIVGAGPVGLTAACMLRYFGIDFVIIDKKESPTETSNALLINMRTLQLLHALGVSEKFITAGKKLEGFTIFASKKEVASLDVPTDFPYDFLLTLPQSNTESILRQYLTDNGVSILDGTELLSFSQDNGQVQAKVQHGDEEQEVEAKLMLACDGYNSFVRKQCGIHYPGDNLKSHFIMIDAEFKAEVPANRMAVFLQRNLMMGVIPFAENGKCRILAEVGRHKLFNSIDVPTLADMQAIAAECVPGAYEINNLTWASKFWVHEHLANQYNQDNIYLLGDAAHAHSPAGGMGMNTGMQDAINLCWKINMFLNYNLSKHILSTYVEERRPVAEDVISLSSQMTKMMTISGPIDYTIRNLAMRIFGKFKSAGKEAFLLGQHLNITYEGDILISHNHGSGATMPNIKVMTDAGLDDFYQVADAKSFYLLGLGIKDFSSNIKQMLAEIRIPIQTMLVSKDDNEENAWHDNTLVVVRPDKYIGITATKDDDVIEYFNKANQQY